MKKFVLAISVIFVLSGCGISKPYLPKAQWETINADVGASEGKFQVGASKITKAIQAAMENNGLIVGAIEKENGRIQSEPYEMLPNTNIMAQVEARFESSGNNSVVKWKLLTSTGSRQKKNQYLDNPEKQAEFESGWNYKLFLALKSL